MYIIAQGCHLRNDILFRVGR